MYFSSCEHAGATSQIICETSSTHFSSNFPADFFSKLCIESTSFPLSLDGEGPYNRKKDVMVIYYMEPFTSCKITRCDWLQTWQDTSFDLAGTCVLATQYFKPSLNKVYRFIGFIDPKTHLGGAHIFGGQVLPHFKRP